MKLWKRLTTLALAILMICSMSLVAFAAEEDDILDITITNTVDGAKYYAFRLLNASASLKNLASCEVADHVHQSSCYNVGYAVNSQYLDILEEILHSDQIDVIYTSILAKNATQIREFADAVYEKIIATQHTENKIEPEKTATADGDTVVFEDIGSGYWMFVEELPANYGGAHSLVVLDTSGNRDIQIHTKREQLTLTKRVLDNVTNYGTYADMEIGETATFLIEADVPDLAGYTDHEHGTAAVGTTNECYKYVIHDKMDTGLTFIYEKEEDVAVYIDRLDDAMLTVNDHYTVDTDPDDDCAFHIVVNMEKALTDSDINFVPTHKLVIRYKAQLNNQAKHYKTGSLNNLETEANKNTAWLNYSNDPYDTTKTATTTPASAYVWTFPMTVHKTDSTHASLEKAIFVMTRDPSVTKAEIQDALGIDNSDHETPNPDKVKQDAEVLAKLIPLKYLTVDNGVDVYRLAEAGEDGTTYWFEAKKVTINGLDDETDYYLHEIRAPEGYNILKDAVSTRIHVSYADTEKDVFTAGYPRLEVDGLADEDLTVDVINQTGTELPSTGGIGTTIFYVLGSIMVLGAAVLLITKKRMGAEV